MLTSQHQKQHHEFPPVIGVDLLSVLLNKTPQTIFADRSRAPHKVPPACVAPGCKQPRWITADVIDWLRQYKEPVAAAPVPADEKGAVGRPTKAEQIRRRKLAAAVEVR